MRVLDLFCGAGGAAMGYSREGFEVVGVDVRPQPRFPFEFVQGDALEYLRNIDTRGIDLIHASPPCQGYSIATASRPDVQARYPRLIPEVRDLLNRVGVPWVIENVALARREMEDPQLLCGRMFGLGARDEDGVLLTLDRHRLFETNWGFKAPTHHKHDRSAIVAGVYGGSRRSSKPDATPADDRWAAKHERRGGYVPRSRRVRQALMGIDWMNDKELAEAIPPAYTLHIGAEFCAMM